MASSPLQFSTTVNHQVHHHVPPRIYRCSATTTITSISLCSSSSKINPHHPFPLKRNSWLCRCHATSSPSEPPPEKHQPPSSGVTPKETLQIFFVVLLWMSLFFWSCAWDRGDSGRPNKNPWFRK